MATLTKAQERRFHELRVLAALRWTAPVEPDVPPPTRSDQLTRGWIAIANRVEPGCSSSIYHGSGTMNKTTSQGARALHSTKLRALRAMRNIVERDAAQRLAQIDAQIEDLDTAERG